MDDEEFFQNIRTRVRNSEEEQDPDDFDYLFTDDVTSEEADRYYDILYKKRREFFFLRSLG